jgi:uncharacterized protein (DUF488 family)
MARITRQLYTIGYAGHTLETFTQILQAQHISILLDIRMTPISRKKGFSKTALSQAMESSGITYQHLRTLGSPKALRQHLSAEGDYEAFFNAFRAYLNLQEESLQQAAELVSTQSVCLMCVEQCADECHRSVVAEAIAQVLGKQISIQHLPVPGTPSKAPQTRVAE